MLSATIHTIGWIIVGLFALGSGMSFILLLAMLAASRMPVPEPEPGEVLPAPTATTPPTNERPDLPALRRRAKHPQFSRRAAEVGASNA